MFLEMFEQVTFIKRIFTGEERWAYVLDMLTK